MRIITAKNYEDMSRKAANIISAQIIMNPKCVLGLATGSTPMGAYKQLVDWYNKDDLDFSMVRTVNLDEYKGLDANHEQSYRHFMDSHLFSHVNMNPDHVNIPNGIAADSRLECQRYDDVIAGLGGIDLQVLGIGLNGHIAFNEPDIAFEKKTHLVTLTQSTIAANSRLFNDISEVPTSAYTMGIKNIVQAKMILLIVSGEEKADIMYEAFCGPVTPAVPASILQMHNQVIIVGDAAALAKLSINTTI